MQKNKYFEQIARDIEEEKKSVEQGRRYFRATFEELMGIQICPEDLKEEVGGKLFLPILENFILYIEYSWRDQEPFVAVWRGDVWVGRAKNYTKLIFLLARASR